MAECCSPGGVASSYEFTPSGFTDKACNECADLNGERIVLSRVACAWGGNIIVCSTVTYEILLTFDEETDGSISANLAIGPATYKATNVEDSTEPGTLTSTNTPSDANCGFPTSIKVSGIGPALEAENCLPTMQLGKADGFAELQINGLFPPPSGVGGVGIPPIRPIRPTRG